jgi:arginine N-succinyltransferase
MIGVVGPETRGVERMLAKIGFSYARRIDPFDGGPHYVAKTDEIKLGKTLKRARLLELGEVGGQLPWGVVAVERAERPRFTACGSRFRLEGDQVALPKEAREGLGVVAGDEVWVQPL